MVKLVDRYIGRAAVLGILAVWLVLTCLFMVFGLLSELRSTEADYSSLDAIWFVLLTLPRMAYQVFPVSALLGALVGGLILGVAESTSTLFLPATLKQVVSFSILIIIMLFRPQGLFGGKK